MKAKQKPVKTIEMDWSEWDNIFEGSGIIRAMGEYMPDGKSTAELAAHYEISQRGIRRRLDGVDKNKFTIGWKYVIDRNGAKQPIKCYTLKKPGKKK